MRPALSLVVLLLAAPAAAASACPGLLGPRPAPPAALADTLRRLGAAIAARDAAVLATLAAPDIRTSLGGEPGRGPLAADDPAWTRLAHALAPGCAPAGPGPAGPWECPGLPDAGEDPADEVFLLARNVRLRAAPALGAPVLATLSCRMLRGAGPAPEGWVAVTLPDARRGFVAARFAWPRAGHRAVLERRDGAWRLTYLVPSD